MADKYITVSFNAETEQRAMIAALLMDIGFEGVEEKDHETIACVAADSFDEYETKTVFDKFGVAYKQETIEQQNWNAAWEQSFEPVLVGNFVAVRASFHPPVQGAEHEIVITPKMSFGTGHHATTFLMIQEMQHLDFSQKTVIDFGTGTGVLAILAEKLGAKEVTAIDNDDWSIRNAEENIAANNCHRIFLQQADEMISDKKAHIILANINLNVIIKNIALLKKACFKESRLLLSGLLLQDEMQITRVLTDNGFEVIKCVNRNNWIALLIFLI
jgi:ribosomal protein L11 methyltransferase